MSNEGDQCGGLAVTLCGAIATPTIFLYIDTPPYGGQGCIYGLAEYRKI